MVEIFKRVLELLVKCCFWPNIIFYILKFQGTKSNIVEIDLKITNNTSKSKIMYTRRRTMGEKGENPTIRSKSIANQYPNSKFFSIFVTPQNPYIKGNYPNPKCRTHIPPIETALAPRNQ